MLHMPLFKHQDRLALLHEDIPLKDKLAYFHEVICSPYSFITRIAIVLYDTKTDLLKTYLHSSHNNDPLSHYQATLSSSRSLQEIISLRQPRVVNDLGIFRNMTEEHTRRIKEAGYQSSYTMPMFQKGNFIGFLFFNADETEVFDDGVLYHLDLYGHLLTQTIINEMSNAQVLVAALNTIKEISQHRDSETGSHLDRMSRYSRLIARSLAPKYEFSDEFVEQIFMYSPLHDIGKIAIPDNILLKPGKLDPEEFVLMQSHTIKGRRIIDAMLDYFGMSEMEGTDILRNIAELHHEMLSGKGYPYGLKEDNIPMEARIIAVADIFDALTSERPYKEAWSNEQAVTKLEEMAGTQLDHDCVKALTNHMVEVEQIQAIFQEEMVV